MSIYVPFVERFNGSLNLTAILTSALSLYNSLRIFDLNQRLQDLDKDIRSFEQKQLMTVDELKNNVEIINQINMNLKDVLSELEVNVTVLD